MCYLVYIKHRHEAFCKHEVYRPLTLSQENTYPVEKKTVLSKWGFQLRGLPDHVLLQGTNRSSILQLV